MLRVAALGIVFAVTALPGAAHAKSIRRTETTDPLVLSAKSCGASASDLTQLPPHGTIGTVFDARVLNLRVGQKLTDSQTGLVTATVTKVELLHRGRADTDLRVRAMGSDASCTEPGLVQNGWTADPRVRFRYLEVIPNTDCADASAVKAYGVVTWIVSCRYGRGLAADWYRRCHTHICHVRKFRCDRRRDGLVDCVLGRREVSWTRTIDKDGDYQL